MNLKETAMVDMVPTTLNNVDNTTQGERKFYKFINCIGCAS